MNKKVLVLSSGPRRGENSDSLVTSLYLVQANPEIVQKRFFLKEPWKNSWDSPSVKNIKCHKLFNEISA